MTAPSSDVGAGQQGPIRKTKLLDRLLRDERIARARPYIPRGAVLLDIGCGDGELLRRLSGHIERGVGIEPTLADKVTGKDFELIPGRFPDDVPTGTEFDVITVLAVLEHLRPADQALLAEACAWLLKPGGRIVVTVPSARVDDILHVLLRLHLIAGMSAHEHYGFRASDTLAIFTPPRYRLVRRATFQFRLNNLFVFERCADPRPRGQAIEPQNPVP